MESKFKKITVEDPYTGHFVIEVDVDIDGPTLVETFAGIMSLLGYHHNTITRSIKQVADEREQ